MRYYYWLYRQRSCFRLYDLPGDVTAQQIATYRRLHDTDELPNSAGIYHICLNCGRINGIVMPEKLVPSKKLQGECQTHDCNSCSIDISLDQIEDLRNAETRQTASDSIDVMCSQRSDRRRQFMALPSNYKPTDVEETEEEKKESMTRQQTRKFLEQEMLRHCRDEPMKEICLMGRVLVLQDIRGNTRVLMQCPECLSLMRYDPTRCHGDTISCCREIETTTTTTENVASERCYLCNRQSKSTARSIIVFDDERVQLISVTLCQSNRDCYNVPLHLWSGRLLTKRELDLLRTLPNANVKLINGDPEVFSYRSRDVIKDSERRVRKYRMT